MGVSSTAGLGAGSARVVACKQLHQDQQTRAIVGSQRSRRRVTRCWSRSGSRHARAQGRTDFARHRWAIRVPPPSPHCPLSRMAEGEKVV